MSEVDKTSFSSLVHRRVACYEQRGLAVAMTKTIRFSAFANSANATKR
jgi:hypothetical protein